MLFRSCVPACAQRYRKRSGDKNTIYVFSDDALSKIEKGSYIIRSAGKIRMSYGTMKKSTYRVKASNGDTNFISKDNSFPTRFLAGKDGATKSKAFDGTYGVNGSSSWRLVFQKAIGEIMELFATDDFKIGRAHV